MFWLWFCSWGGTEISADAAVIWQGLEDPRLNGSLTWERSWYWEVAGGFNYSSLRTSFWALEFFPVHGSPLPLEWWKRKKALVTEWGVLDCTLSISCLYCLVPSVVAVDFIEVGTPGLRFIRGIPGAQLPHLLHVNTCLFLFFF